MSWYSIIYIYVRNVRQRRPVLGLFLHLSLYGLLIVQLLGAVLSYYVYTYVVCGKMLKGTIQKCIYLSVYNSIFFMVFWSLFQTLWKPVSRVPDEYKADSKFDKKIKEVTPCENGRYLPDKSTDEQASIQKAMLEELVHQKGSEFVETDHWERYRYCYQCSHLKPDRCHHCNSCGFCTVKFDHHCPWINKCISHRNYKFFLLYIFYACLIIVWSFLTSFEAIVRYFIINQKWVDELDEIIQVTICVIMHGTFGYYPLGELLIYHLNLISINETTCEQAKPPIIRGDKKADYNHGCYHNFRSIFGWGLWLFPVDTTHTDGMHFPVRYTETCLPANKLAVRSISRTEGTVVTDTIASTNQTESLFT